MTRLRRVAVVLAALAVVGTTIPTGGLSSASAERSVSVDVVPDDEAFLGVVEHNQTVDPGLNGDQGNSTKAQVVLLTLTNRFPTDLTVEVSVGDAGAPPPKMQSLADRSFSLPMGHARHVEANVVCGGGGGPTGSDVFTVEVVASGTGIGIELTRHVTIECEAPPDNGNGSSKSKGTSDVAVPSLP